MKTISSLFISFLFSFATMSQINFNDYQELKSHGEIHEDFYLSTREKVEQSALDSENELSGSEKLRYEKEINFEITELLHSGGVVYGDTVSNYIKAIGKELLTDDPDLFSELRFYTIKSNVSNAFSTDQGIIFFTTGLISHLNNKEELAFILAHEISHYVRRHVLHSHVNRLRTKKKNRTIEKFSLYSQKLEFEADSVGYRLYEKAGFSSRNAISALEILRLVHMPFGSQKLHPNHFNNLFFIPEKKYEVDRNEVTFNDDDTLSTHPNIQRRLNKLGKLIVQDKRQSPSSDSLSFLEIRNISRFEDIIQYLINDKPIHALYCIDYLSTKFPENTFLQIMEAKSWLSLATNPPYMKDYSARIQGNISEYYSFFSKMTSDVQRTLALKSIYNIWKRNTNNPNIKAIWNRLGEIYNNEIDFNLDRFSNISYSEAKSSLAHKQEIPEGLSRIERLKLSRQPDSRLGFDSTNFHLYGLSEFINDSTAFLSFKSSKKNKIINLNDLKILITPPSVQFCRRSAIIEKKSLKYRSKGISKTYSVQMEEKFYEQIELALKSRFDNSISEVQEVESDGEYSTTLFNLNNFIKNYRTQIFQSSTNTLPINFEIISEILKNENVNAILYINIHNYFWLEDVSVKKSEIFYCLVDPFSGKVLLSGSKMYKDSDQSKKIGELVLEMFNNL